MPVSTFYIALKLWHENGFNLVFFYSSTFVTANNFWSLMVVRIQVGSERPKTSTFSNFDSLYSKDVFRLWIKKKLLSKSWTFVSSNDHNVVLLKLWRMLYNITKSWKYICSICMQEFELCITVWLLQLISFDLLYKVSLS